MQSLRVVSFLRKGVNKHGWGVSRKRKSSEERGRFVLINMGRTGLEEGLCVIFLVWAMY